MGRLDVALHDGFFGLVLVIKKARPRCILLEPWGIDFSPSAPSATDSRAKNEASPPKLYCPRRLRGILQLMSAVPPVMTRRRFKSSTAIQLRRQVIAAYYTRCYESVFHAHAACCGAYRCDAPNIRNREKPAGSAQKAGRGSSFVTCKSHTANDLLT